ncbi:hypothetical protein evm_014157 [Chilo suppressalis]|nr:hypothetical protein evm_014157 [Chilo suppressalis]
MSAKPAKRYYYACSVFGCLNTTKSCDYTFFTFPNDIEKRTLWLSIINREDVTNKWSTCLRVCEAHFESDSLIKSPNRTLLKKGSVPKLLLPAKKYQNKQSQAQVKTTESYTQYDKVLRDYSSQTPAYLSANIFGKRKIKTEDIECSKKPKTMAAPETNIKTFHKLCDKFLSGRLSKVVKEQAKLKCQSPGNRYSTDFKIFCLNLFQTSPQAYNLIHESLLIMPGKTTLKQMCIPIKRKANIQIMEMLKTKVSSMTDIERNCSLVIDSINLKANLFYNIKEDRIFGFREIDETHSSEPAKYALVAMIHGIFINYKQPVGFALLSEDKKYEQVSKWIDELIKKLYEIGLKIRVLVSDIHSGFGTSAKERNVTTESPYFFVASHKIYYIFDATRLIKSVRDNFMHYNFHFDTYVAKWDHIIQFYEKDKTQQPRMLQN